MNIKIDTNAAEVAAWIRRVYKDQAPFATAKALNAIADDIQKAQRAQGRESFTLRNPRFFDRSIKRRRSDFASKRNLEALVRVETPGDPSRSDIFTQHEKGGRKRPKQGSRLAVPIDAKRTPRGQIRKRDRIRALNLRPVRAEDGSVEIEGDRGSFMVRGKSGNPVILQRQGRRAKAPVRLLYTLERSVPLKPRLKFVETARAVVPRVMSKRMTEAWADAIRTSR